MTVYAVDIETTTLDYRTGRILGMGYYSGPNDKGYLTNLEDIKAWIEAHQSDYLIYHGGIFDRQYIKWHVGVWAPIYWDTKLSSFLLLPAGSDLSLENCYATFVRPYPYKDTDFITTLEGRPVAEQAAYCLLDCEATLQTFSRQLEPIQGTGNLEFMLNCMVPAYRLLTEVGYAGIRVSKEQLQAVRERTFIEFEKQEQQLYNDFKEAVRPFELAKVKAQEAKVKTPYTPEKIEHLIETKYRFNFFSDAQLKWLLVDQLKVLTKEEAKNKKKKFSVDRDVLERFQDRHALIKRLIVLKDLRAIITQCETYSEAIKEDGRIHTTFSLTSAGTGRTSSSDPNIQNVIHIDGLNPDGTEGVNEAEAIRAAFLPDTDEDCIIVADYSMIEPAVMASLSMDPVMLKVFQNDLDFYGVVANAVLKMGLEGDDPFRKPFFKQNYKPQREYGKILGLSIAYGLAPPNLARDLTHKTKEPHDFARARQIIDDYNYLFPGIMDLRGRAFHEIQQTGRVTTLFGQHIMVPKDRALHLGINTLVQNSASWLTLMSQEWMRKEQKKCGMPGRLLNLVHDEAVYSVPKSVAEPFKQLLTAVMCHGWKKYAPQIQLKVPLSIETFVGPNWACKA